MDNIISIIMMIAGTIWIGLLLAAFLGKAFLSFFSFHSRQGKRGNGNSVIAEAVVLATEQVGDDVNKRPKLMIRLQVSPLKGRNFVIEIKEVMRGRDLLLLKTGSIVQVTYNPANTRELFLLQTPQGVTL